MVLRPARARILLPAHGGLVGPALRLAIGLDRLVLLARVVVFRHRNNGGVQELPAARDVALPRQIAVDLLEHRLDHHHRVHRLAPRPRFARRLGLAPDPFQKRAKLFSRHEGVDLDQQVPLGIQARVAV